MTPFQVSAIIYLSILNVISMLIIGFDKQQAKHQRKRVSEKTLLLLSLMFGSFGIYVGVFVFQHKTKKKRFVYGLPPLLLLQSIMIIYYVFQF